MVDQLSILLGELRSADARIRRDAAYALGAMHERAVPGLLEALRDPAALVYDVDERLGSPVAYALGWHRYTERTVPGLIVALEDPNPQVRKEAAVALRVIGPGAGKADGGVVAALLRTLADDEPVVRREAAAALGIVQPGDVEVAQALLARLLDEGENEEVRAVCGRSLARIGVMLPAAEPIVFWTLSRMPKGVRVNAVAALLSWKSRMVSGSDIAVSLGDEDKAVRYQAWQAAGATEEVALSIFREDRLDECLSVVRAVVRDPSPLVRSAVARCSSFLGNAGETLWGSWVAASLQIAGAHFLQPQCPTPVRLAGIAVLGSLTRLKSEQREEQVFLLCEASNDMQATVRGFAVSALTKLLDASLAQDRETLLYVAPPCLRDSNPGVRQRAAVMLAAAPSLAMLAAAPSLAWITVREVKKLIESDLLEDQLIGIYALQQVAGGTQKANLEFEKVLRNPHASLEVRETAVSAIRGSCPPTLVRLVIRLLLDSSPRIRKAAEQALTAIGPTLTEDVEHLVGALTEESENSDLIEVAVTAFGVGPAAVMPLAQVVSDPRQPYRDRCTALAVLGALGTVAEPAIPTLVQTGLKSAQKSDVTEASIYLRTRAAILKIAGLERANQLLSEVYSDIGEVGLSKFVADFVGSDRFPLPQTRRDGAGGVTGEPTLDESAGPEAKAGGLRQLDNKNKNIEESSELRYDGGERTPEEGPRTVSLLQPEEQPKEESLPAPVRKRGPKPQLEQNDEKLPITREEIEEARAVTAEMQKPIVNYFQSLLNRLAGRRVESDEDSKWVANTVNELARHRGLDLVCKDEVVNLKWQGRVFRARPTSGDGKTISGVEFPQLSVQVDTSSRRSK